MVIRHAEPTADAAGCLAIYGPFAAETAVSFEDEPPTPNEFAHRIERINRTHAFLVAEHDGEIAGFAYAGPFRLRAAYRYTAEDSVYIHPDQMGRGLGKALVAEVIAACAALGVRQMIAVIGDAANAGSIGLHRALGFRDAGVGHAFGYKFGRWVDVVWMQKTLGLGSDELPNGQGLAL